MKKTAFALLGLMVFLLMAGSAVEQFHGTAAAIRYIYAAPWTIALWCLIVITALIVLIQSKIHRFPVTFSLHLAFVLILAGALTTHLTGEQGQIHLRLDNTVVEQTGDLPTQMSLPFSVQLKDFEVVYYPGTRAPMDYVSQIAVTDHDHTIVGSVSMNNVFSYRCYRFYQSRYDTDGKGTTLAVNHDPWGIGVTYAGYVLLLLSMLLFFFQKRTYCRTMWQRLTVALTLLLTLPLNTNATPNALPQPVADSFAELYVYYNNRVCPLQTLASDLTQKIYGKPSYNGLTAEQVLMGWLYDYDHWANEKIIKIKGKDIRQVLGIEGKYACLNDFVDQRGYKLQTLLQEGNKNARQADEKFRIISMIATGSVMRVLPVRDTEGQVEWFSPNDELPLTIDVDDLQVWIGGMEYLGLCIASEQYAQAEEALHKLRRLQQRMAGDDMLPAEARLKAEKAYNRFHYTRPLAMACATIGLLLFFAVCLLLSQNRRLPQWIFLCLCILLFVVFVLLTVAMSVRWLISGHVPLSNGFETMQFMAWVTTLLTLLVAFYRRQSSFADLLLAAGYVVTGMTLMVSMMAGANPQITPLMPVLQSPLLTVHVAVIMIAYCLLAFIMLNGLAACLLWLLQRYRSADADNSTAIERLQTLSQLLLYPAVFCLTAGIFIGAVWANQSWGRYWGWDPKEVWALITMLVYSAGLHSRSLTFLRRPMPFHLYMVFAFLFVLFTYFGVNFILGGMHSYA